MRVCGCASKRLILYSDPIITSCSLQVTRQPRLSGILRQIDYFNGLTVAQSIINADIHVLASVIGRPIDRVLEGDGVAVGGRGVRRDMVLIVVLLRLDLVLPIRDPRRDRDAALA